MRAKMLRIVIVMTATGLAVACAEKKEAPPPTPPAMKVGTVLQKDVPVFLEAIGQTRGAEEIEVRARVEGFLESVDLPPNNGLQDDAPQRRAPAAGR